MWEKRPFGPNGLKMLQKACLNERVEALERIRIASACRDSRAKSLIKIAQQNDVAGMVWRKAVLGFPTLPSCGVDLGCVCVVNCVC
jgi:hypothetical protein